MVDELTLDELSANRARLRAAVESLARTYDSIDSTTQALVDATAGSAAGGWVPARRPTGFGRRVGVRSDTRGPADPGHGALLSLAEVAGRTGRHPELLRRWCAEGRLPAVLLARAWFIRSSDLPAVAAMPLRSPRSR